MPRNAPYGYERVVIPFDLALTGVLNTAGQMNVSLSGILGFSCTLERVTLLTSVVGTGAGASQVFNVRKGNATGSIAGTVTATLANQGTIAVNTVGTVTAANAFFTDADTLTVEKAAGGTVFSAGGCTLFLTFRQLSQRAV